MITITTAHEATGIPRMTIKRWCQRGQIAGAVKVGIWLLPDDWTPPQLKRGRKPADTAPALKRAEKETKK